MAEQPYTIVVGVSQTSKSPTALTWARDLARSHEGRVVAVRAWRPQVPQATPSGEAAGRIEPVHDTEAREADRLRADVEAVLGPDSGVECRIIRGGRRRGLLTAAKDADLLVVDAPRSLSAGPMFAHRLIYAATCPVVVMPPQVSGEPPNVVQRAGRAVGRTALRSVATAGRPGYRTPPP